MGMQGVPPIRLTPWVRRFLAANGVIYLASITLFTGPWFRDLVAFAPLRAGDRPWTFATYMFLHAGFLQLAFNMLMLLFFGPRVERRMGGAAFARFYLLCGLGGPVLAFGLALVANVDPFIGASAAVFGVALAFALYWPQARIFVFPMPIPLPIKYLVGVLVLLDMMPLAAGIGDGVGQLAHLGGLLFALLYLKGEVFVERRTRRATEESREMPVLVPHQLAGAEEAEEHPSRPAPAAPSSPDDIAREMDRVLDKISKEGMASLTAAERRFLDEMSRHMRNT